jgi:DNA-binding NtrC family response regulator
LAPALLADGGVIQRLNDLLWLSPRRNDQLLTRIKATHPVLATIVMTAYGTIESAVEAGRHGAAEYLVKPLEAPDLLHALRALDQQKSPSVEIN